MSSGDDAAVRVERLSKRYTGRRGRAVDAVVDVSFRIDRGEIFGILGPNGAGRTTTLEEASALCDRVLVMDHGRVLAVGPPGSWSTRTAKGRRSGSAWRALSRRPCTSYRA